MLQLQDDNLSLEEQVKELESVIELTKSDGRAYSPEIRMKVLMLLLLKCQQSIFHL